MAGSLSEYGIRVIYASRPFFSASLGDRYSSGHSREVLWEVL